MQAVGSRSSSSRRSRCLRCTRRRACCTTPMAARPWSPLVSAGSASTACLSRLTSPPPPPNCASYNHVVLMDSGFSRRQCPARQCTVSTPVPCVQTSLWSEHAVCAERSWGAPWLQVRTICRRRATCRRRPRAWASTRRGRSRACSRAASTRTSTRCWMCPRAARRAPATLLLHHCHAHHCAEQGLRHPGIGHTRCS